MGARRLAGVVGQTTLGEAPPVAAPGEAPPPPLPSGAPSPRVYPLPTSSGIALRERQLRWFAERDRRRFRPEPPAAAVDAP
jgi:hypothetical protein